MKHLIRTETLVSHVSLTTFKARYLKPNRGVCLIMNKQLLEFLKVETGLSGVTVVVDPFPELMKCMTDVMGKIVHPDKAFRHCHLELTSSGSLYLVQYSGAVRHSVGFVRHDEITTFTNHLLASWQQERNSTTLLGACA